MNLKIGDMIVIRPAFKKPRVGLVIRIDDKIHIKWTHQETTQEDERLFSTLENFKIDYEIITK